MNITIHTSMSSQPKDATSPVKALSQIEGVVTAVVNETQRETKRSMRNREDEGTGERQPFPLRVRPESVW